MGLVVLTFTPTTVISDSVSDPDRIRIERPKCSVAYPDPWDPYVFGPPGSESISQRFESKSGSFYHQAKIIRKTLIPTVLVS